MAHLIARYEGGATGAELTTEFAVARSAVIDLLRSRGVSIRHARLPATDRAEMMRLFRDGVSQREIARRFKRSPSLVWHALEGAGLVGRVRSDA